MHERRIVIRAKGMSYKMVVRHVTIYGLQMVTLRKRQEAELKVAALMIRFSLGTEQNGED